MLCPRSFTKLDVVIREFNEQGVLKVHLFVSHLKPITIWSHLPLYQVKIPSHPYLYHKRLEMKALTHHILIKMA